MSLFNRITGARGPSNSNTSNNQGNREVCKFYLEGRCRFGDQCRYYHPPRDQQQTGSSQTSRSGSLPYHLNADAIRADLKSGEERPEWPLSAFGPGRDAPRQLLEGALEQSPEELRVQYYLAKASGNTQAYEQSEREGYERSNQQAQGILNDIEGAIKYVIDGKDVHPNREDMVVKGPTTFPWKERPTTGGQATQSTGASTFGRPSTFGRSTPFGQNPAPATQQPSAFGQPSTFGSNSAFGGQQRPGGSAFGQASNLGTQQTSAFGAPSALGSGGGSAFGKPSNLGGAASGGSAFGQASTLGRSSPFGGGAQTASNTQTSAFGQPSAPTGGSTFGKPSPFGAAAAPTSGAFGQASLLGQQSSPFGQQPQQQQQQSTFGQPSAPAQTSTFGQASAPAQQQQSPFGQASPFGGTNAGASRSPFGQQASTTTSQPAFGTASNLGNNTNANVSTFGAPSSPAQRPNPFGSGVQQTASSTQNTAFGSPAPVAPAATRAPGQPPTSWKGQQLSKDEDGLYSYRNPATGKQERIWFPEGPPGANPDVEAANPQIYDEGGELARALIDIYGYVKDHGKFGGDGLHGLVPEIPPRRTWVNWEI